MSNALTESRRVRAVTITHAIQVRMELRGFSNDRCPDLVREGDYLAGLLHDSPCEQLGLVVSRALAKPDERSARNALVALEHELTEGVC